MRSSMLKGIKDVCERAVKEEYLAGLNVLVIKNGQEIAYEEAGFIDKEKEIPVKRDSIFRLYSMSKPVTAAAAWILIERGIISLDEPVSKYIPAFKDTKVMNGEDTVPAKREIMIRDLLSMTSGLPYNHQDNISGQAVDKLMLEMEEGTDTEHQMSTLEFVSRLASCPLEFHPGEKWQYGLSADVMGAVIEVASKMKFGEFLKKEIFEPLHMKDTGFFVPEEKKDRFTRTYERIDGKLYDNPTVHLGIQMTRFEAPNFESGGAGLFSTIEDYKRFALMLLNGGKYGDTRILNERTVKRMRTAQLHAQENFCDWDSVRGCGYGNFMRIMEDQGKGMGLNSLGEYGWDGWLGCYFSVLPEENTVILSMQQLMGAGTNYVTNELRNVIISNL